MPLVSLVDLLNHARRQAYAVPALEVWDLAHLHGILRAAEGEGAPVILTPPPALDDERRVVLLAAMETAARRSRVPVVLHCRGIADAAAATTAINAGCNSLEAADEADVATILALADACGVPLCAARPVSGLACLKAAPADLPADAAMPLSIHSGRLGSVQCRALIEAGVAMVHVERQAAGVIERTGQETDYASLAAAVTEAVVEEAVAAMRRWGAAGRSRDAQAHCRPWAPVEHVIIFNAEGIPAGRAEAMMRDGRRILGAIPGVRQVFTGRAVKADARYRYCWLVRFVHPAVIASYRDHPDHVAFADQRFRPVAGDRISIDYGELPD